MANEESLTGLQRINVQSLLAHMTAKEYRVLKIKEADKNLRLKGNLQEVYSDPTLRRVRTEALSLQDLDKNDILDLFARYKNQLMEVVNKVDGAEFYIQHVNAAPFYVFTLSDAQLKVLTKMISNGDIIVLYVDATVSVVDAPQGIEKRIYYYTALL